MRTIALTPPGNKRRGPKDIVIATTMSWLLGEPSPDTIAHLREALAVPRENQSPFGRMNGCFSAVLAALLLDAEASAEREEAAHEAEKAANEVIDSNASPSNRGDAHDVLIALAMLAVPPRSPDSLSTARVLLPEGVTGFLPSVELLTSAVSTPPPTEHVLRCAAGAALFEARGESAAIAGHIAAAKRGGLSYQAALDGAIVEAEQEHHAPDGAALVTTAGPESRYSKAGKGILEITQSVTHRGERFHFPGIALAPVLFRLWTPLHDLLSGAKRITDIRNAPSRKVLLAALADPDALLRVAVTIDGPQPPEDVLAEHEKRLTTGMTWLRALHPDLRCRFEFAVKPA